MYILYTQYLQVSGTKSYTVIFCATFYYNLYCLYKFGDKREGVTKVEIF